MNQFMEINSDSQALTAGTGNERILGSAARSTTATVARLPMEQSRTPSDEGCPSNPTAARPTKRKVVHYFLGLGDAAPRLHKCDNAWVPSCLRAKDTTDCEPINEEDAEIEVIQKKLMAILNKITPENMTLLTNSITSLPINSKKCLNRVIDTLFQKAIEEPNFSPQYAHVSMALHNREVNQNDKKSKSSFKNLLTKCCQDRLYQLKVHEQTMAKDLKAINDCEDQDTKERLQSTHDQDEMTNRKKSVGNCRFMCELYRVGILTSKTLETSMKYLIKSPNEETLECACNILKHTGKILSHKATFKKLEEYTSDAYRTKIPTRIRFMIQDTIDLKDNNWLPRNARLNKEPVSIQRAPASTVKPAVNNDYKPVQYVPTVQAVYSRKNAWQIPENLTQTKVPTIVPKDDVSQSTELVNSSNNRNSSDDENEIQKKCRCILDEITPKNMVSTATEMTSLPIKTQHCLEKVVELLFQKAMDEPTLAPQYAHVCLTMKHMEVQSNDQKSKISFRTLLVTMCQHAFESISTRKRDVAKDRNNIESCKDKETRKQLQSRFDENELDHRRRSVANCRFMCELVKVNVLAPPIVEMCAEKLTESQKENAIDCLHVILKHAGNALDFSDALDKLYKYGTALEMKISSSLRSKILDLLHENGYMMRPNTCDKPPALEDTDNTKLPPVADEQPRPAMTTVQGTTSPKSNVYKTVKSVIRSVTAENLNSAINELSAHITSVDGMEKTVDLIFATANIRSNSIPELIRICSSLKNIVAIPTDEHAKPVTLKKQVMVRSSQVLRSGIEDDSSAKGFSHKEPYAFVGELFNANVLSAHTLLEFLQIIPNKLTNRGLENTCCLLKAAGKKLEQVHNLKKTIRKLTNMVSNDVERIYSRRSSTILEQLVELRDKKWVSECK